MKKLLTLLTAFGMMGTSLSTYAGNPDVDELMKKQSAIAAQIEQELTQNEAALVANHKEDFTPIIKNIEKLATTFKNTPTYQAFLKNEEGQQKILAKIAEDPHYFLDSKKLEELKTTDDLSAILAKIEEDPNYLKDAQKLEEFMRENNIVDTPIPDPTKEEERELLTIYDEFLENIGNGIKKLTDDEIVLISQIQEFKQDSAAIEDFVIQYFMNLALQQANLNEEDAKAYGAAFGFVNGIQFQAQVEDLLDQMEYGTDGEE